MAITGAEGHLTFFTGKFLLTYLENRGKEKREMEERRKEGNSERKEDGKLKMEGKKCETARRGPPFFFLCLLLFETTGICLGCTKMENYYREKAYFTTAKIMKSYFAPSEKC